MEGVFRRPKSDKLGDKVAIFSPKRRRVLLPGANKPIKSNVLIYSRKRTCGPHPDGSVMKLVYMRDSKSLAHKACRFESDPSHHFLMISMRKDVDGTVSGLSLQITRNLP